MKDYAKKIRSFQMLRSSAMMRFRSRVRIAQVDIGLGYRPGWCSQSGACCGFWFLASGLSSLFLYHKEAFGDSGAACDDIGFLGSPASPCIQCSRTSQMK